MLVVFQVAALTILLFSAQDLLRRAGKWVSWGLFLAVPAALTPYWLSANDFGPFMWFKLYTVCFCVCWGTALRFTPLGRRPWAGFTIHLLLAANILEATTLDVLGRGPAHALNALAGVLLVVTLPYGLNVTRVDTSGPSRDLHSGTARGWVLGYTLWNWTFVYLNYPELTGHHTAVLAAALIVARIDPRLWVQTRAYTLGLNLLVSATCYDGMVSWLDTSKWYDARLALVAAGIALACVAGCAIRGHAKPWACRTRGGSMFITHTRPGYTG